MSSGPDLKLEAKVVYGFRRQNMFDTIKTLQANNIVHKIIPVGIGKICSIRQKLEIIMGDIFIKTNKQQNNQQQTLHPFMTFLIKKVILYESLLISKRGQMLHNIISDLTNKLQDTKRQNMIRLEVEKFISVQFPKNDHNQTDKSQLKFYKQKVVQWKKQALRQYQQLIKQNDNLQLFSTQQQMKQYMNNVIENVDAIEPLRVYYQNIKYRMFIERGKQYYGTKQQNNNIRVGRLSENEDALQTIATHISQRNPKIDYKPQSIELIKDIFELISKFEKDTSRQNFKSFYESLSPQTVLFDQITLAPKLSYEPLILDTLGLKNRPMSIENRISFYPTPKTFDYFQSLPQLDEQGDGFVNIILNFPHYGNTDLYEIDKVRLKIQQTQAIKQQKVYLQNIKESMVVWRFLLLSYFIKQSKQFGFEKGVFTDQKRKQLLRQKLLQQKQKLLANIQRIHFFTGIRCRSNLEETKFNFYIEQIRDYMVIQDDDSVVINNKYQRVRAYFTLRNSIIKEMVRMLISQNIFGRIFNVKKFIFMFLIISIEILEESYKTISVEKDKIGERAKLKTFLMSFLKRLKKQKTHYSYMQSTFEKIKKYEHRRQNDSQYKYLMEQQQGKQLLQITKSLNSDILDLQKEQEKLDSESEKSEATIKKSIEKIRQIIVKHEKSTRQTLNETVYSELFMKYREGPHKSVGQNNQSLNYYTKKFYTLVIIFITLKQSNFIMHESLTIPLLNLQENQSKKIYVTDNLTTLSADQATLSAIEDIIEIKKHQPKKMLHGRSQKQSNQFSKEMHPYTPQPSVEYNLL